MDNLSLYDIVRNVPESAQKKITGGKLNGKTDINPMWRIKKLTEQFGPCGIGWYLEPKKYWTESCAGGEVAAFVEIFLHIKYNGEWSFPIPGIGGSMLIQTEKGKLVSNDECYKMAYTDAISVACKALGMGADIYWENDKTKYSKEEQNGTVKNHEPVLCSICGKEVKGIKKPDGTLIYSDEILRHAYGAYGAARCYKCMKEDI